MLGMKTLCASALAALLLATAAAAALPPPSLRLVARNPVAVKGAAFTPGSAIVVRATSFTRTWTTRVAPDAQGSFLARFRGLTVGRCGISLRIDARASDGKRAMLRLPHIPCAAD
jgi:hypothetical protein